MESVKTTIKPFDNSLCGQRLLFEHRGETRVGTIIAVTRDRVIYMTEDGDESWSWISPNGQRVAFSILSDVGNSDFIEALKIETAYIGLIKTNQELQSKIQELERADKLMSILKEFFRGDAEF